MKEVERALTRARSRDGFQGPEQEEHEVMKGMKEEQLQLHGLETALQSRAVRRSRGQSRFQSLAVAVQAGALKAQCPRTPSCPFVPFRSSCSGFWKARPRAEFRSRTPEPALSMPPRPA